MVSVKQKFRRAAFNEWFDSDPGKLLAESENEYVSGVLPNLFGYYIVQMGLLNGHTFLDSSRIGNRLAYQLHSEGSLSNCADLCGDDEYLPFATDSIDVVFAPHVLEFSATPHKLLREIERILIGDGHLLVLGFNPWSLWGLWRMFLAWRDRPPWNGHFYSTSRIKDWLYLLDFEVLHVEKIIFRPPLRNMRLMQKLSFLEKLGQYCWPYFGSVYLILAQKKVVPLTPIKMRWQKRRQMISSGIVEPTTRTRARQ